MKMIFHGVQGMAIVNPREFGATNMTDAFTAATLLVQCEHGAGGVTLFGKSDKPFSERMLIGEIIPDRPTSFELDCHNVESIEMRVETAVNESTRVWNTICIKKTGGAVDEFVLFNSIPSVMEPFKIY